MKLHNGKPLLSAEVDPEKKGSGMKKISWTGSPANKMTMLEFEETQPVKMSFVDDNERRLVTVVVMQPDFPMYRDIKGKQFYVQYSADSIEVMRDKFFMEQSMTSSANIEHTFDVDGTNIVESWIVDESRGILAPKNLEVPDRTLLMTFRIINDQVWESIKDGTFKGVSLEGFFDLYEEFTEIMPEIINFSENPAFVSFNNVMIDPDASQTDRKNALIAYRNECEA